MHFLTGTFMALNLVHKEYSHRHSESGHGDPLGDCWGCVSLWSEWHPLCGTGREGGQRVRIIHQTSRLSGVLCVTEKEDGVTFGFRSLGPGCMCGQALSLAMCLGQVTGILYRNPAFSHIAILSNHLEIMRKAGEVKLTWNLSTRR